MEDWIVCLSCDALAFFFRSFGKELLYFCRRILEFLSSQFHFFSSIRLSNSSSMKSEVFWTDEVMDALLLASFRALDLSLPYTDRSAILTCIQPGLTFAGRAIGSDVRFL